jgi:lipopolysaccharide biosynthesis glycosyltransferase
MIRVFVGSGPQYAEVEPVMEGLLRDSTDADVEVTFMRAGENGLKPSGCTGFTMYRFAVPSLAGREGFAIYLDVDMFVFGDIAKLWGYRQRYHWACLKDGSNEVMVIDCEHGHMPSHRKIHQYRKGQLRPTYAPVIPSTWNHEDKVNSQTKLLHFTDMGRQPWFHDGHELQPLWEELREQYGQAT